MTLDNHWCQRILGKRRDLSYPSKGTRKQQQLAGKGTTASSMLCFTVSMLKARLSNYIVPPIIRNRKHVPCFYRVIETRVEVSFGRTRNAVGTRAVGECFRSFFEFSQTFTSVPITR